MAFQMDYSGYPESYWRLASYTLSPSNKFGGLRFIGFKTRQERLDGKAPIGEKHYVITPAIYDEYFKPDLLNPEGKNPLLAGYVFAAQDEFFAHSEEV